MVSRERSDIVCMACARILGEVEWRGGALRLVASGRPALFEIVDGRMICGRCGGRGFVAHHLLAAS